MRTLDLRKDEALERTFKGVARNFREVFAELVPGGRGELVMQRAASAGGGGGVDDEMPDAAAAADDNAAANGDGAGPSDAAATAAVPAPRDKYSGVRVKVSFGGGRETTTISSLSGGQKTLVALALIFAIQRCDPAPFYLCDEVDAALDPAYRSAVAALVAKTARAGATANTQDEEDEDGSEAAAGNGGVTPPAQFIITTFHPQLVSVADRVYGVSHANRVSRIALISKGDALQFVQTEEARAQKASAAAAAAAAAAAGGGKGGGKGGGGGGAAVAVDA